MKRNIDVPLGTFYGVTAAGANQHSVSILNQEGLETLIPIKALAGKPIRVTGEFGDFGQASSGHTMVGVEPCDVTGVEISVNFKSDEFLTRLLRLKTAAGHNLTWELFSYAV